jgi:hypothetical protein
MRNITADKGKISLQVLFASTVFFRILLFPCFILDFHFVGLIFFSFGLGHTIFVSMVVSHFNVSIMTEVEMCGVTNSI